MNAGTNLDIAQLTAAPAPIGDPIRSVLETAHEAFVAMDAGGRITEWNPQAEVTFGWKREEALGRTLAETIIPPALRDVHRRGLRRFLDTGEGRALGRRLELSALHRDGHEFPVEVTISADCSERGPVFNAFLHDITDRKRLEAQNTLIRELALGVAGAGTVDDALAFALERISRWAGWDLGEAWIKTEDGRLLERKGAWYSSPELELFGEITPEGDPVGLDVGLPGRVWSARKPIWVRDVREDSGFLRADVAKQVGLGAAIGVPVTAGDDIAAVLIFFASEAEEEDKPTADAVAAVASHLGSLVERKRTEDGLRESEARYRLLAENSTDVISVTDAEGVIRYVSPSCLALTGFTPEELIGRDGRELVHPEDLQTVNQSYTWAPGEARRLRSAAFRVRRKDGGYVWIEATVRPVLDPATQEVREMQATARDVTERMQFEQELERSNTELERFAYDASHDIAEPLKWMGMAAGRLGQEYGGRLDDEGRRLLVSLVDGLDRMQTLVSNLLEYSLLSLSPMERTMVDCSSLLRETLSVLEESIEERQAQITFDALPTIRAHPTRLGQCFQNLLSNALKFAHEDEQLRIHVGAARESESWRFWVKDNGVGFDPSEAPRAFELFGRLQPWDACAGNGMGLSICKRVIEQHGGRIWAESVPGAGSTFYFTIPDEPPSG